MSADGQARLDVTYEASLPHEMASLSFPDGEKLLARSGLDGPITSVNTMAHRSGTGQRWETLLLCSVIDLAEPITPGWVASEMGLQMERAGKNVNLPHSKQAPTLGTGIIWDRGDYAGPTSSFNARDAGLRWDVNTVLERKGSGHIERREDAEDILAQHIWVLGGLMSVIFDLKSVPKQPDQDYEYLLLEMPRRPLELVEIWPEGDGFEAFIGIDGIVGKLRNFVALANLSAEEISANNTKRKQALLLHGPSGTGKTDLLKTVSHALGVDDPIDVSYKKVSGTSIWESAVKIDATFEEAYSRPGRTVIIMDDMEGIVNTGNPGSTGNITNVLKKQLERIKEFPEVYFLCATEHRDRIDGAIQTDSRIPSKIHVELPTDSQREQMLNHFLVTEPLSHISFDSAHLVNRVVGAYDFKELLKEFNEFSAGDIKSVLEEVGRQRLLRAKQDGTALLPGASQAEIIAVVREARRNRS